MSDFRLKVFASVARNLSFTRASHELLVSQPTITKHIKELESAYGVRLFERMGNKIALTDAGRILMQHCDRIIADYKALEFEMNLLRGVHKGELRLGASTTISQYILPPLLARFAERFPQVALSLVSGNSTFVEQQLHAHAIDLGLVEGSSHQPDLKYSHFMRDELVAVVAAKNSSITDEISLEQLTRIPLVLREQGSGTLDVILKQLALHKIKLSDLKVLMHLGSTESIKAFIDHSNAMGIVSIRSIAPDVANGRFRIVDIDGLQLPRNLEFVELHGAEEGLAPTFISFISQITKSYNL